MTSRRAFGALLAAVALIGTACSSPTTPAAGNATASPVPSSPPVVQSTGAVPSKTPTSTAAPAEQPGSRTATPAPASGGLKIEIIIAECLERGRPATATIRTAPGSMIVASATYSDGQSHYNYWVGTANPSGEYPVAWTPPPDAPLGSGKFLVGVQSDEGGNTATKPFRLARGGGCS